MEISTSAILLLVLLASITMIYYHKATTSGITNTISTRIEMAAPPAKVREVFLDFPSYPTWSEAHLKSITITSPSNPQPKDLKPGNVLKVSLPGATFSPTVTANTSDEFKWLGSLWPIFSGEHSFRFKPAAGGEWTLLVQDEEFSGWLAFLVKEDWRWGRQTKTGFEGFNRDLKARVEALGGS